MSLMRAGCKLVIKVEASGVEEVVKVKAAWSKTPVLPQEMAQSVVSSVGSSWKARQLP